jgi:1,4-dihydroxy-2-naphthoyl-CoA hydrolase
MNSIWFNPQVGISEIQHLCEGNMGSHVGIEFVLLGDNFLSARMPVDYRTKQPLGLLHGGASVVLAETLGSVGAMLTVDPSKFYCVGLEINANHIKAVTNGFVFGKAMPVHIGRKTQVWEIKITTEGDKLVCISRITMAVLERKISIS